MADTTIEWTDKTWNPTTGCDQVSPGCDNCYALTMAKRLKGMGAAAYQEDGDPRTSGPGFKLQMHPDRLDAPLRWRKPALVFVNSMSDLFHPRVTDEFIAQVFAVMALTPQHTYQVLTKRPKRMKALLNDSEWWYTVESARCRRFVLVLPCGRSAHLELGWAVGMGKRTAILLDEDGFEPELMYRMVDHLATSMFDLLGWLGVED